MWAFGNPEHQTFATFATFADGLTRFAGTVDDAGVARWLTGIALRVGSPLGVAVLGRRGVGRGTVTRALACGGPPAGLVVLPEARAELCVYLLAEVVKPEDERAVAALLAARRPVLVVLNKADLSGFAGDGPLAAAWARCRQFSAVLGVPVLPVTGLLAVVGIEGVPAGPWAALRELAARPGAAAAIPAQQHHRLLDTLDLFGTALAISAVRQGNLGKDDAAQVAALLRRVSGIDAVLAKLSGLGAQLRYRRVLDAVAEIEAGAVGGPCGERIGEFLAHDDTVLTRLAAAVDVAGALGLPDPADQLSRALHWQRYARTLDPDLEPGPDPDLDPDLHRACASDIVRGSLRLWAAADRSRTAP